MSEARMLNDLPQVPVCNVTVQQKYGETMSEGRLLNNQPQVPVCNVTVRQKCGCSRSVGTLKTGTCGWSFNCGLQT
jgi:hypothetical protein